MSFTLKKKTNTKGRTDAEQAYEKETEGDYQDALIYYNRILKRNSKNINALLGKAQCLRGMGSSEEAIKYYTKAAKAAYDKKDRKSEYDALSGLIEMRPNNFTNYNIRGDLLYSQGKYTQAAQDFRKVTTLDRHNLKAYYKMGDAYYKSKSYHEALEAYQAAEELHFADPKAQACLAKTYRALDDKKNTKKAYEKFKELATYSAAKEYKKDPEWKKVLNYLGVEN